MLNMLSVFSVAGTFVAAINIFCALSPAAVLQIFAMPM